MLPPLEESSARLPIGVLASLLREHCAAGRLRNADPHLLAQAFGGLVLAFGVVAPILRWEPAADTTVTAPAITDLFLTGALPRKRAG